MMNSGIAANERELDDLASFALELAMAARKITLSRSPNIVAEDKGEGGVFDPVTEADRAAETAIRDLIGSRYPHHGIGGEEFAAKTSASAFEWSVDPIDGTRSYICGLPTWTTLIALLKGGRPVLGMVDAPALDETYIGLADRATLISKGAEARIRTSGCTRIADARFSTTDPFLLWPPDGTLQRVLRSVRVSRFGYDGYAYARLAGGSIDLVIESGLKPYDYHAHIPIIRAAGGHVGDWRGGNKFAAGNVIAAASRELYEQAVELLADA